MVVFVFVSVVVAVVAVMSWLFCGFVGLDFVLCPVFCTVNLSVISETEKTGLVPRIKKFYAPALRHFGYKNNKEIDSRQWLVERCVPKANHTRQ